MNPERFTVRRLDGRGAPSPQGLHLEPGEDFHVWVSDEKQHDKHDLRTAVALAISFAKRGFAVTVCEVTP